MTISTTSTTSTNSDGLNTSKDDAIDNKHTTGTLSINSTVVHNNLKAIVEHNHFNSSVTSSIGRGSAEANAFKAVLEGNGLKAWIEGNLLKTGIETSLYKTSYEKGNYRLHRNDIIKTKSISTIIESKSHFTNKMSDFGCTQHLGKRLSVTIPPYLDVAIIDAGKVKKEDLDKSSEGGRNWYKSRFAAERMNTIFYECSKKEDETNFIKLNVENIPAEALHCLENLPEWNKFRNLILGEENFKALLLSDASPTFPGLDTAPFTGFTGGGANLEQAHQDGATCRLQVSHGANQTIQIASNSLRTIRFNPTTSIDYDKNSVICLGGKYEHTRGQTSNLVEGSFIQHHRKIAAPSTKSENEPWKKNEPINGIAKFRFEDDVSFAFVESAQDNAAASNKIKLTCLWGLKLSKELAILGDIDDSNDETLKNHPGKSKPISKGISIKNEQLNITHGKLIKLESGEQIIFSAGISKMTFTTEEFCAGDLRVNFLPVRQEYSIKEAQTQKLPTTKKGFQNKPSFC